jgi:hypothetical protein
MVYKGRSEFTCVFTGWMCRKRFVKVVCERPRSELGRGFLKIERQTFLGRSRMFRRRPGSTVIGISLS